MIIRRLVDPRSARDPDAVDDHATGVSEVIDVRGEPSAVVPAKSSFSQILSVGVCGAEEPQDQKGNESK